MSKGRVHFLNSLSEQTNVSTETNSIEEPSVKYSQTSKHHNCFIMLCYYVLLSELKQRSFFLLVYINTKYNIIRLILHTKVCQSFCNFTRDGRSWEILWRVFCLPWFLEIINCYTLHCTVEERHVMDYYQNLEEIWWNTLCINNNYRKKWSCLINIDFYICKIHQKYRSQKLVK